MAGRARRALGNYLESFTAFVALDLAFAALHGSAGIWPAVWIVARVAYLPLYLFNVVWVRSLVWGVSLLALLDDAWTSRCVVLRRVAAARRRETIERI